MRKGFPDPAPQGWTSGQRQLFWKVTPRKRSFWWEKNWLEMTERETRSLGDSRQVGGAESREGEEGARRSTYKRLSVALPRRSLQLPGLRVNHPDFSFCFQGQERTSWSRRQLRSVFRAPPPFTPPEPPNRGNQTKLAARI